MKWAEAKEFCFVYMSMRVLSPGGNGPHGTAGMRIGRMASTVRRLRTLEELCNFSRWKDDM